MLSETHNTGTINGTDWNAVLQLPATLRQLAECGDADLVEELIAMFQTDTMQRLESLRRALAARNLPAAGTEAHTIKGSALQVGANRFAAICQSMEVEVRKPAPADLLQLLAAMNSSFDEVCRVIAARRSGLTTVSEIGDTR